MQRLYKRLVLLLLLPVYSCGPTVFFEKPQPRYSVNRNKFLPEYTGKFASSDSTILIITDNMVIRWGNVSVVRTEEQLRNSGTYRLSGDSLLDLNTHQSVGYTKHKDTVEFYTHVKDTLFMIDHESLLRKYREHYILNYKISPDNWYVKKLSLEKDRSLTLSEFKIPDDIQAFRKMLSVQEIRHEEVPTRIYEYVLNPSRHQFKRFVNEGGFRKTTLFKRLSSH